MKIQNPTILPAALLALLTMPAHAAITYVDAVEGASGNTFATGGSLADTSWLAEDSTAGLDGAWRKRTSLGGNGDSIIQALPISATAPPPIPELTTTLALADGTYDIWVFFWTNVTNETQNWVISTGLTSGSLVTYNAPGQPSLTGVTSLGVFNAGDLDFTENTIITTEPNREMYGVKFENIEVTGGGLNVYVDMLVAGSNTTQRVQYDGVGFELIPEPSTALLAALGTICLLRRRR